VKKLLLAGTAALLMLSTSARADPYEAARAASRAYQASKPKATQTDPYAGARVAQREPCSYVGTCEIVKSAACLNPIKTWVPTKGLSPAAAEAERKSAEAEAEYHNSEFCKGKRQEYTEAEKQRTEAEAKRQMEIARQMAEAQKRAAEEQAKQKAAQMEAENQYRIWFSKPENKLLVAYELMHRVQYCRQVRDGYLVINISEPEYDRATIAVKAIEKVALQAIPDLNTDDLWKQGEQRMYRNSGFGYNNFTCKQFLQELYKMSPTTVYQYPKP
jgi:hypothetical protein